MAKLVAIDNGHGLNTAGKRTPPFPDTGLVIREWEFNHPTAKKLEKTLQRCGLSTLMTSDTEDDTPLAVRSSTANKANADVFVSIHFNAFQGIWGPHGGIGTHYYPTSASGKKLASVIQKEIVKVTGFRNRGIVPQDFHVVRETKMPAVLCECGFMDNLEEASMMLNEDFQQRVAEGIAKGVCEYLGVEYIEPEPEPKPEDRVLYRVQTGAFGIRANADALLARVKAAGFDTYMVYVDGLYKVQVGAYAVKANADNMAKTLKAKGFDIYITTKSGQAAPTAKPKPEPVPKAIKVGSRVKIKQGARSYEGKTMQSFVYSKIYTVDELKGKRAVLDLKGLCTAFHVDNLILQ